MVLFDGSIVGDLWMRMPFSVEEVGAKRPLGWLVTLSAGVEVGYVVGPKTSEAVLGVETRRGTKNETAPCLVVAYITS